MYLHDSEILAVDRYYEGESRGSITQITESATNLTVIEKLADAVGQLAAVLRQLLAVEDIYTGNALYHAQRKLVRFKNEYFVDFCDFLKVLQDKYAGDNSVLQKLRFCLLWVGGVCEGFE